MKARLTILFIFLGFILHAQLKVGYLYDLDKLPIHGIINPREYSPENLLTLTHRSDAFEKGVVYFKNGSIDDGWIKYQNKKIWFKPKKTEKDDKLKPNEVISLTIGVDSFFVANYFNVELRTTSISITEPQFMQFISSFGGYTFAKHYHFSSAIAQNYAMTSPIVETYQVSDDGGKTWESFPRRKKLFKEMALIYFSHIPYIQRKLIEESLGFNDILTLIKTAQYYDKYVSNKKIHFDKFWNEIPNSNKAVYSSEVKSLKDSIWTISYSNKKHLLYEGTYSSLFPHKRHGTLTMYNENEQIIYETIFENDEKKSENIAYSPEVLHYSYDLIEFYNGYNSYTIPKYNQINDTFGNTIILNGEWTEEIETPNGIIHNEFYNNTLSKAFRIDGDKNIYRITDPEYNFKLKKLQNSLSYFFKEINFTGAAEDNAQGIYFLRVSVSDKGRALAYEMLNEIHPELDKKIRNWANKVLDEKGMYPHKFKPYKIEKEKVSTEFLVPIQFSILKFYKQPAYNHNSLFLNQMMFQQQMMQPLNLPTPPPRF